jgi:hypothetical protein
MLTMSGFKEDIRMNIVKDGFQVRKIPAEEVSGAIAPIYLLGLPGDLDKLHEQIRTIKDVGEY